MTVLQILLAILASSGFFSVILAILNRHWSRKDNKMSGLESIKTEIDQLKTILENHIAEDREQDIRLARREILRFNDEVRRGVQHTEESFDDILECIDVYERYCDTHPAFENNKAVLAIGNLKRVYQDRLTHNDFL